MAEFPWLAALTDPAITMLGVRCVSEADSFAAAKLHERYDRSFPMGVLWTDVLALVSRERVQTVRVAATGPTAYNRNDYDVTSLLLFEPGSPTVCGSPRVTRSRRRSGWSCLRASMRSRTRFATIRCGESPSTSSPATFAR